MYTMPSYYRDGAPQIPVIKYARLKSADAVEVSLVKPLIVALQVSQRELMNTRR